MSQASDWSASQAIPRPIQVKEALELPELSVILPCHNEAGNVASMYQAIASALPEVTFEVIFIDDGSTDTTFTEIDSLRQQDIRIQVLRFVANAGHQAALRAGYRAARGTFIATLDSDGQHPPEYLPHMLTQIRAGFEVVQMIRSGDQGGFLKNGLSRAFYTCFNAIADSPIPTASSDFRMVNRFVCDTLNQLPERHLVLRAILPALGFRTATLNFAVKQRQAGKSTYTLGRSWRLMSDSLFNFSTLPLRLMRRVGLAVSSVAFLYGLYNVGMKFFGTGNVPGYTDIIASVLFLSGLILLYLGVLGRYLEIVIDHLRLRPEYLIRPESSSPTNLPQKVVSEKTQVQPFGEGQTKGHQSSHDSMA